MPRMKSVFVIAMIFLFSEGIPPAVPIDDFAIIDDEKTVIFCFQCFIAVVSS